jgi:hypothetical protein
MMNLFVYCQGENMDLWQNFFWLVWSIATFCVKVSQFVQNLATTSLAHSFKHLTPIPFTKINAQPTQLPMHKSLESLSNSKVPCYTLSQMHWSSTTSLHVFQWDHQCYGIFTKWRKVGLGLVWVWLVMTYKLVKLIINDTSMWVKNMDSKSSFFKFNLISNSITWIHVFKCGGITFLL